MDQNGGQGSSQAGGGSARTSELDSRQASAQPGTWVMTFSPLPTSTRLDQYVIQSVLGAGDYGITYVALHEGRGKRFVLKEYFPRSLAFRDGPTVRPSGHNVPAFTFGLDRFLAESRALARLRHSALVEVSQVFEAHNTAYVAQTYEQGRDFRVWLHEMRGTASQEQIDKLLQPLLQSLEMLHGAGLLHREITPESLLVRDDGSPVLVDFGGVREALRRRNRNGAMAATHGFAPPEQFTSDQDLQGAWTDIYSLAGMLYLAVSGQTPPVATTRILSDAIRPAAEVAKGAYRSSFLAAIDLGLQFRPGDRPQTVAEWRQALMRTEAQGKVAKPTTVAQVQAAAQPAPASNPDALVDLPELEEPEGTFMEQPGVRMASWGLAGLVGGAVAGALASVMIASIAFSECFSDACVGPLLMPSILVGAAVGLVIGVRMASARIKADQVPGADDY